VSVDTGNATATNDSDGFVGQNVTICANVGGSSVFACSDGAATVTDVSSSTAINLQEGDNRSTLGQAATATSGDGVAGEVIGAVTSAGGSASIVAANTSRDSDVTTGEAEAANVSDAFVGQNFDVCADIGGSTVFACSGGTVVLSDITDSDAFNLQEGDNRLSGRQTANASTGDGVAGQVIGAVSAGATSIDATSRSEDVSVETGDATAANASDAFVGQNFETCGTLGGSAVFACSGGDVTLSDVTSSTATNVQEGDNRRTFGQSANASSGDAVAGQVTGVVTSAGGSASVVVANTSTGIDSSTGESEFSNEDTAFVGLNVTGTGLEGIV
jgi:hypothetical protein